MPPTYSPWLNAFERLARVAIVRRSRSLGRATVGDVGTADCRESQDWRAVASAPRLFEAWSPPPASPWSPFARPTLFAALDAMKPDAVWPSAVPSHPGPRAPLRAPEWARRAHAIVVDAPAEISVAFAAFLALRAGFEPVVTFNNWPHAKGVVDMWRALGALLHFAPWVIEARREHAMPGAPARPPVFVLDNRRLGARVGLPGEFDNRYYLSESDLPSAALLKRHGVERVVYARAAGSAPAAPRDRETDLLASLASGAPPPPATAVPPSAGSGGGVEQDDLNAYVVSLAKQLGIDVAGVDTTEWAWTDAREHRPAPRKTPFNTGKDPAFRGFKRSAAGGFGELVPEPSSGGGGSG